MSEHDCIIKCILVKSSGKSKEEMVGMEFFRQNSDWKKVEFFQNSDIVVEKGFNKVCNVYSSSQNIEPGISFVILRKTPDRIMTSREKYEPSYPFLFLLSLSETFGEGEIKNPYERLELEEELNIFLKKPEEPEDAYLSELVSQSKEKIRNSRNKEGIIEWIFSDLNKNEDGGLIKAKFFFLLSIELNELYNYIKRKENYIVFINYLAKNLFKFLYDNQEETHEDKLNEYLNLLKKYELVFITYYEELLDSLLIVSALVSPGEFERLLTKQKEKFTEYYNKYLEKICQLRTFRGNIGTHLNLIQSLVSAGKIQYLLEIYDEGIFNCLLMLADKNAFADKGITEEFNIEIRKIASTGAKTLKTKLSKEGINDLLKLLAPPNKLNLDVAVIIQLLLNSLLNEGLKADDLINCLKLLEKYKISGGPAKKDFEEEIKSRFLEIKQDRDSFKTLLIKIIENKNIFDSLFLDTNILNCLIAGIPKFFDDKLIKDQKEWFLSLELFDYKGGESLWVRLLKITGNDTGKLWEENVGNLKENGKASLASFILGIERSNLKLSIVEYFELVQKFQGLVKWKEQMKSFFSKRFANDLSNFMKEIISKSHLNEEFNTFVQTFLEENIREDSIRKLRVEEILNEAKNIKPVTKNIILLNYIFTLLGKFFKIEDEIFKIPSIRRNTLLNHYNFLIELLIDKENIANAAALKFDNVLLSNFKNFCESLRYNIREKNVDAGFVADFKNLDEKNKSLYAFILKNGQANDDKTDYCENLNNLSERLNRQIYLIGEIRSFLKDFFEPIFPDSENYYKNYKPIPINEDFKLATIFPLRDLEPLEQSINSTKPFLSSLFFKKTIPSIVNWEKTQELKSWFDPNNSTPPEQKDKGIENFINEYRTKCQTELTSFFLNLSGTRDTTLEELSQHHDIFESHQLKIELKLAKELINELSNISEATVLRNADLFINEEKIIAFASDFCNLTRLLKSENAVFIKFIENIEDNIILIRRGGVSLRLYEYFDSLNSLVKESSREKFDQDDQINLGNLSKSKDLFIFLDDKKLTDIKFLVEELNDADENYKYFRQLELVHRLYQNIKREIINDHELPFKEYLEKIKTISKAELNTLKILPAINENLTTINELFIENTSSTEAKEIRLNKLKKGFQVVILIDDILARVKLGDDEVLTSTKRFDDLNGIVCLLRQGESTFPFQDIQESRDKLQLMPNDVKNKYKDLIKLISDLECLQGIFYELFESGSPLNSDYKFDIRIPGYDLQLKTYKDMNEEWKKKSKALIEKNYICNFFFGRQATLLQAFFNKQVNQRDIEGILKFIFGSKTIETNPKDSIFEFTQKDSVRKDVFSSTIEVKDRFRKLQPEAFQNGNPDLDSNKINPKFDWFYKTIKIIICNRNDTEKYLLNYFRKLTGKPPCPQCVLFCDEITKKEQVISFIYRFFCCNQSILFSLVNYENLNPKCRKFVEEAFLRIHDEFKDKFNGCLLFLTTDRDSQFINKVQELASIPEEDSELAENTLYNKGLRVESVTSEICGLGKSFHIKKYAKDNKLNYIYFPISGTILVDVLVRRLKLAIKKMNSKTLIHFDIDEVSENSVNILNEILFKLIVLKGLFYTEDYLYLPSSVEAIFLELSKSVCSQKQFRLEFLTDQNSNIKLQQKKQFEFDDMVNDKHFKENIDIVTNYLQCFDKGAIQTKEIKIESLESIDDRCKREILEKRFGIDILTYYQKRAFINSLADQLRKLINNYCFSLQYLSENNFNKESKKWVFENFLNNTQIFVKLQFQNLIEKQVQNVDIFRDPNKAGNDEGGSEDIISFARMGETFLLCVFDKSGSSIYPIQANKMLIPQSLLENYKIQENNNKTEQQLRDRYDYASFTSEKLVDEMKSIFCVGDKVILLGEYVVTPDNFLKMNLIYLKVCSQIPVIMMGECGCGKTSLLKIMVEQLLGEMMITINFHAGITQEILRDKLIAIFTAYENNPEVNKVWVFFDEINTSDSLGLISEVMIKRTLYGSNFCKSPEDSQKFLFIAAVNPFRVKTKHMREVGLRSKHDRGAQRLAYTVNPLPVSLLNFVYDFGVIKPEDEKVYIRSILKNINLKENYLECFTICLASSQKFIRAKEEASSVSLRDIKRFTKVYLWFTKLLSQRMSNPTDIELRSLILSLYINYYFKLAFADARTEYQNEMLKIIKGLKPSIDLKYFSNCYNEEVEVYLKYMDIPPGIARNESLKENIFVIIVGICNNIPVIISGKPGCSKTLAVNLVQENLNGKYSEHLFFQSFPKIYFITYQGSLSSTSEEIEKVFHKAYKKNSETLRNQESSSQQQRDEVKYVIYFDELGLAEIAPSNPLKVLHALLEPEVREFEKHIGFVGLSNWRLDASKLNRAFYLAKTDPEEPDLEMTAYEISKSYGKDLELVWHKLKKVVPLYCLYKERLQNTKNDNFHGTRDFYNCIKQISASIKSKSASKDSEVQKIINHAILRNFGGLKDSVSFFQKNSEMAVEQTTVIELIKENISDPKSRYLMIITKNQYGLDVFSDFVKENSEKTQVLIGSSFQKDKIDVEYKFRLLSSVIDCTEGGKTLIMQNLTTVYPTLYDLFNQNFRTIYKEKKCRISLGYKNNSHCTVKENFKCIIIMDEGDVADQDPPFLNRFEKQYLDFQSELNSEENRMASSIIEYLGELFPPVTATKSLVLPENRFFVNMDKSELHLMLYLIRFLPEEIKSNKDRLCEICVRKFFQWAPADIILVLRYQSTKYPNQKKWANLLKSYRSFKRSSLADYLNCFDFNGSNNSTKDFSKRVSDSLLNNFFTKTSKLKTSRKFFVFTFSNIFNKIEGNDGKPLFDKTVVQDQQIDSISSEKEFANFLEEFLDSSKPTLILRFDFWKDWSHVAHIKYLLENTITDERFQHKSIKKQFIFIIHIDREKYFDQNTDIRRLVSPSSDWNSIFLDRLNKEENDITIKELCEEDLPYFFNKFQNNELIEDSIRNSILKLKFDNNVDLYVNKFKYINYALKNLPHCTQFQNVIKEKIKSLLEKDHNWCERLIFEGNYKYRYYDVFTSIKNLIRSVFDDVILKYLFVLEEKGALHSYYFAFHEKPFDSLKNEIEKTRLTKRTIQTIPDTLKNKSRLNRFLFKLNKLFTGSKKKPKEHYNISEEIEVVKEEVFKIDETRNILKELWLLRVSSIEVDFNLKMNESPQSNKVSNKVCSLVIPFVSDFFKEIYSYLEQYSGSFHLLIKQVTLIDFSSEGIKIQAEKDLRSTAKKVKLGMENTDLFKFLKNKNDLIHSFERMLIQDFIQYFFNQELSEYSPQIISFFTKAILKYHSDNSLALILLWIYSMKNEFKLLVSFFVVVRQISESSMKLAFSRTLSQLENFTLFELPKMVLMNILKTWLDDEYQKDSRSISFFEAVKNEECRDSFNCITDYLVSLERALGAPIPLREEVILWKELGSFAQLLSKKDLENSNTLSKLFKKKNNFESQEFLKEIMQEFQKIKKASKISEVNELITKFESSIYGKIFLKTKNSSIINMIMQNEGILINSYGTLLKIIEILGFFRFDSGDLIKNIENLSYFKKNNVYFGFINEFFEVNGLDRKQAAFFSDFFFKEFTHMLEHKEIKISQFITLTSNLITDYIHSDTVEKRARCFKSRGLFFEHILFLFAIGFIKALLQLHFEKRFHSLENNINETKEIDSVITQIKHKDNYWFYMLKVFVLKLFKRKMGLLVKLAQFDYNQLGITFVENYQFYSDRKLVFHTDEDLLSLDPNMEKASQDLLHELPNFLELTSIGLSEDQSIQKLEDLAKEYKGKGKLYDFIQAIVNTVVNKFLLSSDPILIRDQATLDRYAKIATSPLQNSGIEALLKIYLNTTAVKKKFKININSDPPESINYFSILLQTLNCLSTLSTDQKTIFSAYCSQNPQTLIRGKLICPGLDEGFSNSDSLKVEGWKFALKLIRDPAYSAKGIYICSCFEVYFIENCGRPWEEYNCLRCKEKIGGNSHKLIKRTGHKRILRDNDAVEPNIESIRVNELERDLKDFEKNGRIDFTYPFGEAKSNEEHALREMTPFTSNLLGFISYSCLYLLWICGKIPAKDILSIIHDPMRRLNRFSGEENIAELFHEILKDIYYYRFMKNIPPSIMKEDIHTYLLILIDSVIKKIPKIKIEKADTSSRIEWENKMGAFINEHQQAYSNEVIIDGVKRSLKNDIRLYKEISRKNRGNRDKVPSKIFVMIEENDDYVTSALSMYRPLFPLMRYTSSANPEDLANQLKSLGNAKSVYPYLSAFLEYEIEISKFKSMFDIICFIKESLEVFNYRILRDKARDITIEQAITDFKARNLKRLFPKFKAAWEAYYCHRAEEVRLGCQHMLPKKIIGLGDQLSCILPDDKELYGGMYMSAFLQEITETQNKIISMITDKIPFSRSIESFFSEVSILKAQENDFFNSGDVTLAGLAEKHSYCNLEYGQGSHVNYNFKEIEDELHTKLFYGRRMFNKDIKCCFIKYQLEINKENRLISELRGNIQVMQAPLNEQEAIRINKYLDEKDRKQYLNFYNSIQIVVYLVINDSSTKFNENSPIHALYQSNLQTMKLDDDLLKMFKILNTGMNKLEAVFDLLEERAFPFLKEKISNDYKISFDKTNQKIIKFLKFLDSGQKFSRVQLAKALRRFISKYLVFTNLNPDGPLRDQMLYDDIWDINVYDEDEMLDPNNQFINEFPLNILLKNTLPFYEFLLGTERSTN